MKDYMTFNLSTIIYYDMHKGYCGNSGTYNLSETMRRFCKIIGNTSGITTTDSPGRQSRTSGTTQCPITTCPTCPNYTEGSNKQETTVAEKSGSPCLKTDITSSIATMMTVMYDNQLLYLYNQC